MDVKEQILSAATQSVEKAAERYGGAKLGFLSRLRSNSSTAKEPSPSRTERTSSIDKPEPKTSLADLKTREIEIETVLTMRQEQMREIRNLPREMMDSYRKDLNSRRATLNAEWERLPPAVAQNENEKLRTREVEFLLTEIKYVDKLNERASRPTTIEALTMEKNLVEKAKEKMAEAGFSMHYSFDLTEKSCRL